jgi:hypothetical protein
MVYLLKGGGYFQMDDQDGYRKEQMDGYLKDEDNG